MCDAVLYSTLGVIMRTRIIIIALRVRVDNNKCNAKHKFAQLVIIVRNNRNREFPCTDLHL